MQQLVIEYKLDTKQPGYAFATPVAALPDALVKTVWRQAMPRGKGWGTASLVGARALKCFPVSEDRVALSTVTVTDQVDEEGRKGIRRAEIEIISMHEILMHLRQVISAYPEHIQHAARQTFGVKTWAKIIDHALPRPTKIQPQLVFTHPYGSQDQWQRIEAVMLMLATAWPMRALPGWGKFFSFTTFALTNEDEARIVALPSDKVQEVKKVRIIPIK